MPTMASRRCFSKNAKVNSFLPSCTANRFCARSYSPPLVLKVDMPARRKVDFTLAKVRAQLRRHSYTGLAEAVQITGAVSAA